MPKEPYILFIDQYANLSGGQKVLSNIIMAFSKKGYRGLLCLPGKGEFSEMSQRYGVASVFFPLGYYTITRKKFTDFLAYIFRLPVLICLLVLLIKKEKINIVYANGARTFIWATIACSIVGIPLVWHVHSIFDKGLARKMLVYFGRFKAVKKIFAVSKSAALPLRDVGSKMTVVYNGVERYFLDQDINILKKENNLDAKDFLVGVVGILEKWKNQEDLICAARLIKECGVKDIYYFVVGDSLYGWQERDGYKGALIKLVNEMGLKKEVIFTGFRRDVINVINSLDILVICSKDPDPCPLVSLEAASLAVPIIATKHGGVAEIFKDNEEALFYEPGDFKELAGKIISLFKDRDILRSIGLMAQLKVRREHALDIFLNKITQAVEEYMP